MSPKAQEMREQCHNVRKRKDGFYLLDKECVPVLMAKAPTRPFGNDNVILVPIQLALSIPFLFPALVDLGIYVPPPIITFFVLGAVHELCCPGLFRGLAGDLNISIEALSWYSGAAQATAVAYVEWKLLPALRVFKWVVSSIASQHALGAIWYNDQFWHRVSDGIALLLLAAVEVYVLHVIFKKPRFAFMVPWLRHHETDSQEWMLLYVALMHPLTAVLYYYARYYNESRTFKPTWTEDLG